MKQVTIDYIFRTSETLLFKRLSTASGLSEWFADDVNVDNGIFTFRWKDTQQSARIVIDNKKYVVRFEWLEAEKKYLEFLIEKSNLSKDITLYITDFVEDDEDESDARDLWENTIQQFKRKMGLVE